MIGMVWRVVVWHRVARGARGGVARRKHRQEKWWKGCGGVYVACVVVSGSGKVGSMCMLAAGSLGAISNAAVAWRR